MKLAKRNFKRAKLIAVRALNDYVYYLTDRKRIIKSNLLAGLMRGIGNAFGFWMLSALLIYLISLLADSGVPIIDKIIRHFVEAIEKYS